MVTDWKFTSRILGDNRLDVLSRPFFPELLITVHQSVQRNLINHPSEQQFKWNGILTWSAGLTALCWLFVKWKKWPCSRRCESNLTCTNTGWRWLDYLSPRDIPFSHSAKIHTPHVCWISRSDPLEFQIGQLTTLGLRQIAYIRFRNVEFSRVRKIAKSDYWLRHVSLSVFLSFCTEQLGSH